MPDPPQRRVVVFEDDAGEFRWKRQAGNNRIVASSGEGFQSRAYAIESAMTNFPDDMLVNGEVGPEETRQANIAFTLPVFENLLDIPHDTAPEFEGDDTAMRTPLDWAQPGRTLTVPGFVAELPIAVIAALTQQTAPILVEFKRSVKEGAYGVDIVAIKRALSRAGYIPWDDFTRKFGKGLTIAVKLFQRKHGLTANGVYNAATHAALVRTPAAHKPGQWAFDPYAAFLMGTYTSVSPETAIREKIRSAWMYSVACRDLIGYLQIRPMIDMDGPPNVPNLMDCSIETTWGYKSGGAPDPNGFGYNGWGNTDSQWANATTRPAGIAKTKIADLAHYNGHVTGLVGSNMCVSHGTQAGPLYLKYDYRDDVRGFTAHRLR